MSTDTPIARLNRVIDHARASGLEVEVEREDHYDIESYSVRIRMPHLDEPNALASYHNSKLISVHALRSGVGSAKPFKLHVHEYGLIEHREIRPRILPISVQMMVEDLARYRELQENRETQDA